MNPVDVSGYAGEDKWFFRFVHLLNVGFKDWALTYLQEIHEQEVAGRNTILQSQQRVYQDCLKRLDHLVKLKTAPENADSSLLSDEEYGRQRVGLLKEKGRLEELFQDTGHRVDQWLELSEKTFEFACSARAWFAQGDANAKKTILSAIGSNLILKDKKLVIEAKKPFVILETSLPRPGQSHQPGRFLLVYDVCLRVFLDLVY